MREKTVKNKKRNAVIVAILTLILALVMIINNTRESYAYTATGGNLTIWRASFDYTMSYTESTDTSTLKVTGKLVKFNTDAIQYGNSCKYRVDILQDGVVKASSAVKTFSDSYGTRTYTIGTATLNVAKTSLARVYVLRVINLSSNAYSQASVTMKNYTVTYRANGGTIAGAPWQNTNNKAWYKLSSDKVYSSSSKTGTYTEVSQTWRYPRKVNLMDVATAHITKVGHHPKSGAEWNTNASGTGTSRSMSGFNHPGFADKTEVLYVNWEKNTLAITYYANGGTLDKKTGKAPPNPLTKTTYMYGGTNFASGGLPNANGGTWQLTKPHYHATKYWRVGSGTATTKINSDTKYATVQALAKACGINLDDAGNHTLSLYAEYEIDTHYIDINGLLDDVNNGGLGDFGTCDVYIGGVLKADDVADYNTAHPYGTKYEIKDIKAKDGHRYDGIVEGSLSGTIGDADVKIRLAFATTHPGQITITKKWNDDLEGEDAENREVPKIAIQGENPRIKE